MASPSQIEDVKSRANLLDLIGEYVKLKKAGTNHKGLCPFHNEKTPSFMVSPDKGIWHCFGCGEGGDAIAFLQRMEGTTFPEALRMLADRVGVTIRKEDPKIASERSAVLEALDNAAGLYHKILVEAEKAQQIREYLNTRGISETMWQQFRLGFAPEPKGILAATLGKQGISADTLFQAGMSFKDDGGAGYVDRFRGRLMFPIMNVHGNVIGFGGRALREGDRIAKYINTPETIVYHKSDVLYGIHLARQAIRSEDLAIVVEGYTDCIASHQAGVTNVVASSGTALTEGQLQLIKRYTLTIAVAFDADVAGESATKRGIILAIDLGMNVRVVRLPEKKDPAELIQNDAEAWRSAVADAQPFMDYYMETVFTTHDASTVEGKKRAAAELLPVIAKIPDPIEQTHYLQRIGKALSVDETILRETLKKTVPTTRAQFVKGNGESSSDPQSLAARTSVPDRMGKLREQFLALLLSFPEKTLETAEHIPPERFAEGPHGKLYSAMVSYYNQHHEFDTEKLRTTFQEQGNEDLGNLLDVLGMLRDDEFANLEDDERTTLFADTVKFLRKETIRQRLRAVQRALRMAEEGAASAADQKRLMTEFGSLTKELNAIESTTT